MKTAINISILILLMSNLFLFFLNRNIDSNIAKYLCIDTEKTDSTFQKQYDNLLNDQMRRRRKRTTEILPHINSMLKYIDDQNIESFTTENEFRALESTILSSKELQVHHSEIEGKKGLETKYIFHSERLNIRYKESLRRLILICFANSSACGFYLNPIKIRVIHDLTENCQKSYLSTDWLEGYYDLSIAGRHHVVNGYKKITIPNSAIRNNKVKITQYDTWTKTDSTSVEITIL